MTKKIEKSKVYAGLFLFYCFAGWIYEVVWCNMIEHNRGFINNGFLFGPWLPIYGIGTSIILLLIKKLQISNKWLIFGIGAIASTVAEFIGSYFMEGILGKWLWDYSDMFLNFEGRIALKPSIMFGVLVLIAYTVTPKLKEFFSKQNKMLDFASIAVTILFAIDAIYHLMNGSNI